MNTGTFKTSVGSAIRISSGGFMASWKHNPISQKAGGPNAVGQPGGFAWEGDHTQHVVYRGQDNQIHEVWFKKGGFNPEWKYGGALSALAGGPLADGDPFG